MTRSLREGFTTGTAATGAALAALQLLQTGAAPSEVDVPLPPFTASSSQGPGAASALLPRAWLRLPVSACAYGPAPELAEAWNREDRAVADSPPPALLKMAHASIIKDGGDDPDATSGAHITVTVIETLPPDEASASCEAPIIIIRRGPGVGRVTLPGLPVPVGEPAVNPVPRSQLCLALRGMALGLGAERKTQDKTVPAALAVFISVPQGALLAEKTFNPRLGIIGGISILGTQGTVRPYSHEAWKATIRQGLAVAKATGCRQVCLTTGRRSERLLMTRYPQLPPTAFVQVADFAKFSLHAAGEMSFERLVWGCFFGKLVKLAQGHAYTHARNAELDMHGLARVAQQHKAACAADVAQCVTAAHALELLLEDPAGADVLAHVAHGAAQTAQAFAGRPVSLHLFHTDGRELLAL